MADYWWGFQGTVNEAQWAKLMGGYGQKYTLVNGDPVRSTGRTLYVDPRLQIGCGVAFEHDAVKTVAVPVPAAGAWHLLVARRTWGSSPSVTYALVAGATTADAEQSTPPAALPAARNKTPGLLDDEPVAWVHARASTTTLKLWQMSVKRDGRVPGIWAIYDAAEQGIFTAFSEADNGLYDWVGGSLVGRATVMSLTSNIGIPAGSHTVLTSDTPWTARRSMKPTGSWVNGLVAPLAGAYKVRASLNCAAGVNLLIAAKKNDTTASATSGAVSMGISTGAFAYTTTTIVESLQLAANDVITLNVLSSAAATLRAGFGSFSLERIV